MKRPPKYFGALALSCTLGTAVGLYATESQAWYYMYMEANDPELYCLEIPDNCTIFALHPTTGDKCAPGMSYATSDWIDRQTEEFLCSRATAWIATDL